MVNIVICTSNNTIKSICVDACKEKSTESKILNAICYSSPSALLFNVEDMKSMPNLIVMDLKPSFRDSFDAIKTLVLDKHIDNFLIIAYPDSDLLGFYDFNMNYRICTSENLHHMLDTVLSLTMDSDNSNRVIECRDGEARCTIKLDAIKYFEASEKQVNVITNQGRYNYPGSLKKIGSIVCENSDAFIKVHKSYIVAIKYIDSIMSEEIVLTDGETLPVGRSYYGNIKRCFKNK